MCDLCVTTAVYLQGPIAVAAAKQAVNQGIEQNLADGLNTEWACYEKVW